VVAWLGEVDGPRRTEALESLAAEGVDHETAMIIDTGDGPITPTRCRPMISNARAPSPMSLHDRSTPNIER